MKTLLGKLLYALLFTALIPFGLWVWAYYTADFVRFPALASAKIGWGLVSVGLVLVLWAMLALKKYGKGLPMNAYPPPVFVSSGPYRLFRHPIYVGFGLLVAGYFIAIGSASGLWLVTPIVLLGMVALVLGYEAPDLEKRFPGVQYHTLLEFPPNTSATCQIRDRIAALFWVVALWLLGNFLTTTLVGDIPAAWGRPLDLPVVPMRPYLPLLGLLPLFAASFGLNSQASLRAWALSGIYALSLSFFLALLLPGIAAQYLPQEGAWMLALPGFLPMLALYALYQQAQRGSLFFGLLGGLFLLVSVADSRAAGPAAALSVLVFGLAAHAGAIWLFLKNGAEHIANSWQEWVFGRVRVINHGFYVGFGTFFCILLAGALAGKAYAWAILVFTIIGLVVAALWAQFIEGSEKLKRPFGYYGGLASIPLGCLAVWAMGADVWVVVSVVSVVMPWGQAIGRLRCLVNGCCHGRSVDDPQIGIRYFHPRSRVCGLSDMKGKWLHPTPLYSILWLFWLGFLLLALWNHQFSPPFIFGLYLILTGIGRFVEEAYRGEVQTPILGGLRLYQWTAIASVVAGMVLTTLAVPLPTLLPGLDGQTVVAALLGGAFATFAMGIDFPNSNKRFSRLV